ncbi:sensor histidine kinase [Arthrobacter castelli]|uniref:sensor histidine kinase n=1 Tax=Arthrobacter castelli TaxID=271431 RepID=UPI00040B8074|nr:histidine kinase [Arthrobacter castelli]
MTTTAAHWVPARADVGFAAGYLLLGTVLHLAGMGGAGLNALRADVPAVVWAVVVSLGCVGVVYRSTRLYFMLALTGAALLATVLLGGSVFSLFFTFELIFCAALFGPRRLVRTALLVAVLLTVATVVVSWVISTQWRVALVFGLQAVLVFLVPLSWAGNIRKEKELAISEGERADAARANARHATEIAELDLRMAVSEERSRMARDLHDVIAGHLSAIALQSEAAMSRADEALNRKVLEQVRTDSVTALEQMRSMIDLLHQEMVPDPGLDRMAGGTAQLEALAESARLSGSEVTITAGDSSGLPLLVDSTIYRIVQEALTNSTRHAPGQPVEVLVSIGDSLAEVGIVNRVGPAVGQPSPASPAAPAAPAAAPLRQGHGLRNMQLRTEQLGGEFAAGQENGRWQVSASLPLSARTGVPS